MSSYGDFSFTCYPTSSSRSGTTDCSPPPTGKPDSRKRKLCSGIPSHTPTVRTPRATHTIASRTPPLAALPTHRRRNRAAPTVAVLSSRWPAARVHASPGLHQRNPILDYTCDDAPHVALLHPFSAAPDAVAPLRARHPLASLAARSPAPRAHTSRRKRLSTPACSYRLATNTSRQPGPRHLSEPISHIRTPRPHRRPRRLRALVQPRSGSALAACRFGLVTGLRPGSALPKR